MGIARYYCGKVYYRVLSVRGRTGKVHVPSVLPCGVRNAFSQLKPLNAKGGEGNMPSKKSRLTVYLTPEEHAQISEFAARSGISLSTFAKRICLGMPVPSLQHKQAVQDIIKARADLGRLGGLLKQAIASGGDKVALQRLLREVDAGMQALKAAAMRIR